MSPVNIVNEAKNKGLDIIGITDHNSTLNAGVTRDLAEKEGIFVLTGAEVTSKEEVHSLAFFENDLLLAEFQSFIDASLRKIPNNVDKFGYQLVVNENEEIVAEIDYLLILAINKSIDDIEKEVHRLGGIFILAHIDKKKNSILSQLGFIPTDLTIEAVEFSRYANIDVFLKEKQYIEKYKYIQSSDAHYINDVGTVYSEIECEELSFQAIKNCFR
jgi:PHP family Zn ribbon phosphoesterase